MTESQSRQKQSNLNLERLEAPIYLEGDYGPWKIGRVVDPGQRWGYSTGPNDEARFSHLLNGVREVASTSRRATESHALAVRSATGVVVLAGLKMGLTLFNIIKKDDVDQVFAVDSDPDIIDMIQQHAAEFSWPGIDKVHFIESIPHAFDRRTLSTYGVSEVPNFLYVDLWAGFKSRDNVRVTKAIAERIQPLTVGFWGQELAFIDYCRSDADPQVLRGDQLKLDHFDGWCLSTDMNLQHRSTAYIQHCLVCWTNDHQRQAWESGKSI